MWMWTISKTERELLGKTQAHNQHYLEFQNYFLFDRESVC